MNRSPQPKRRKPCAAKPQRKRLTAEGFRNLRRAERWRQTGLDLARRERSERPAPFGV